MSNITEYINASLGNIKPTLVLKNASVINVFDGSIEEGDIALFNDTIVGIGNFNGINEIDCSGQFAAPGFIDSHVHIESSMVTPEVFSKIVIKHGVTSVIADPHEIANVMGSNGISLMLKYAQKAIIDVYFMLPSCVPAAPFEDNAGILDADELSKFKYNDKILGLGEVMDVASVMNCSKNMMDKLTLREDMIIDGHCPGISEKDLNAYIVSGVKTDHECIDKEEAEKKIRRGMYVLIREGSAAKNLEALIPAVTDKNYSRFLFCTDDRHIQDLSGEGSIDFCIRKAVKLGMDPVRAITLASFNAAMCYGLKNKGAIAPGYKADIVIFDDINDINIRTVIKNGKLYKNNEDENLPCDEMKKLDSIKTFMNLEYIDKDVFKIKKKSDYVNVIKLIPHSIRTDKCVHEVEAEDGIVKCVHGDDILKIAVFERHRNTGKKGVGYIEGMGLKGCSIAQTIAHDSHNVIVVGDNDGDMAIAVNSIINIDGGIVVVSGGKLIEYLSLPVGGLMTTDDEQIVLKSINALYNAVRKYGLKNEFDPFLTLGFLALPVIPEIKITARGLFDYNKFDFIDLFV